MKIRIRQQQEGGGTLIIAMIAIVVLTFITADICLKTVQRYRYSMQSSCWTESLMTAEAGADCAMAAINSGTWTGWQTNSGTAAPTGVPGTSGTNIFSGTIAHLYSAEASRNAGMNVTIDAPSALNGVYGQWYRIRSMGTTGLPHTGTVGQEPTMTDSHGNKISHSYMLRKFSFLQDNTSGLVATPQVSRTVEVLAAPNLTNPFTMAVVLQSSLNMSGGGIIDSFDSSKSSYSNGGLYSSAKRETDASLGLVNATGSDLKSTYVYGTIQYNGTAPANAGNVTGGMTSPYSTTVNAVTDPTWTANSALTVINGSTTITGGSQSNPTLVKVSSLNVPGGTQLNLKGLAGGAQSYIQIWVTGNFNTSGSGLIQQDPNVHVTYYVDGSITVSGGSFNNQSGLAANNVVYATGKSSTTMTVSGNGTFIGTVDAPNYNITLSGAANFSGAFIANSLNISGGASMHYDHALSNLYTNEGATGYSVQSWYEVAGEY